MTMSTVQRGQLLEVLSPHLSGHIKNTSSKKQVLENFAAKIQRVLDSSVPPISSFLFCVRFQPAQSWEGVLALPSLKHQMVYKVKVSEPKECQGFRDEEHVGFKVPAPLDHRKHCALPQKTLPQQKHCLPASKNPITGSFVKRGYRP